MAAKNNNKMNISYTIKAIDRFTATHEKLERQLASLERRASQLDTVDPDITINIINNRADAEIRNTNRLLDSLPALKRVYIHVIGVNKKHRTEMDRLATSLRNMDEILMQMGQGLIWGMLPTLGPMLGAAAGGAGALAGLLIGAGSAMGAFALVAVPTIKYLAKMDEEVKRGSKEWYNLSAGTRDSLTALDEFRGTWDGMQKKFREPTLEIFAIALKSANTMLKMFMPTVEGSVEAVRNLAEAFDKNLASGDVKKIFEWLGKTAGPHLESLMKTLGNFFVGFMNMMVAFEPLTQRFADGFLNMSERFREWTSTLDENDAFQRFLAYTAEQGPVLISFIGNLIEFLVQLGIAMAPVGEVVLDLMNRFLEWTTELMKNHEWIGKLIAGALLFRGALSLFMPIVLQVFRVFRLIWPLFRNAWTWLGKLKTAVGKITPFLTKLWGWITKLISVFARVIPIIGRVGLNLLRFASGPLGIVITVVATLATVIYKNWDKILGWTKTIWAAVKSAINTQIDSIKQKWKNFTTLASILKTKFTEMKKSVSDKMEEIRKTVSDKIEKVKSFLKGISLNSIGKDIINGLVKGIKSIDVGAAAKGIAKKIKDGFVNFFSIHSPSRLMEKDVGRFVTLGIIEGMTGEASQAERTARRIAEAIRAPFDNMDDRYAFTAVGDARTQYANARRTATASETHASPTQSQAPTTPVEAVINIGGHAAKGLITYITREQDHEKGRTSKFKGR